MPTRGNHTSTLLTLICIRLHVYISIHFAYAPPRAATIAHAESVRPTHSLDDASMCLQKAVGFSSLVHGHGGGFAAGSWIESMLTSYELDRTCYRMQESHANLIVECIRSARLE